MKNYSNYFICVLLSVFILTGCSNYRKLLTDEIVLKDGNSQTGTIIKCDSANLKLKKIDESISIIPWSAVDTIQGKKLKTIWFGANMGFYNTPYFSVFRNQPIESQAFGMQGKIGLAFRGVRLYYADLFISPAKPYTIKKFGLGYQRYLGSSTYLTKRSFFVGTEINFMSVQYNNGLQTTFEPYTGFEKKLNDNLRIHFKFGLQTNILNKNKQTGVNLTLGIHFMKKNFKKQYDVLNHQHKMYRK